MPLMIFVTVDQWTLTEPELLPIRVDQNGDLLRRAGDLADLSFSLSERVGIERLGRSLRSLRQRGKGDELALADDTDQAFSFFSRVRFDCLTSPVLRLFGRPPGRRYIRPSTIIS